MLHSVVRFETMKINAVCMSCAKTATLRCTRCKIAFYCCRACQNNDYLNHKATCLTTREGLAKIETAKEELIWVHPDIFIAHIGEFWNWRETRPYMRAQLEHMTHLSEMNTKFATYEAIQHGKLMLVLCNSDDLKVRNLLPALYLRFGTYEAIHECYRFLHVWNSKLWGRSFELSGSVFHIPYRPESAVFEPVLPGVLGTFCNLHHTVAVAIIKIELCFEAKYFVHRLDCLLKATVSSTTSITLLRGNDLVLTSIAEYLRPQFGAFKALSIGALRSTAADLTSQVTQLLNAGRAQNPHIWKALLHPDKALSTTTAATYCKGSATEATHVVHEYAHLLRSPTSALRELFTLALATCVGEDTE